MSNISSPTKNPEDKFVEAHDSLESRLSIAFSSQQQITKFQMEILQLYMDLKTLVTDFHEQCIKRYGDEKRLLADKEDYKRATELMDQLSDAKEQYNLTANSE